MSERFRSSTAHKYERYYNESDFWGKVNRVASQVGGKLLYPAFQLYFLMLSSQVPVGVKTIIVGALGYLILPADLIPDFIPALGFTDDLSAIMLALRAAEKHITPEIRQQAKQQTEKLLKTTITDRQ